jgi:hypothetical protein
VNYSKSFEVISGDPIAKVNYRLAL